MGVMENAKRPLTLLGALVLGHFVVALIHGAAHSGAGVALAPLPTAFVLIVIMAGPVAGLAVAYTLAPRAGAWVVASTMAAALVFGVVNHFILASPDHVLQVAAPWQFMFGATAVVLAASEALAAGVGVWCASPGRRRM
jgi:hypothetical protein